MIKILNLVLIFLPYIYLDKMMFKSYAFYISLSNYIIFLINSSINNASTVKIFFRNKPFSLFVIKVGILIAFLPILLFYTISTNNFNLILFLLTLIFAVSSILNIDFYFKGANINNIQRIQFISLIIQNSILFLSLYYRLDIIYIFSFFAFNSILCFLFTVVKYNFKIKYFHKPVLIPFITSLFLVNILNLLYYNLDVIISFYLKDPVLFKNFFMWTRVFSIVTVISTVFSEYFNNRIFIRLKPNVLDSDFEKFYILLIIVAFIFIYCLKSIYFSEYLSKFPKLSFLISSYTNYYLIVIPISFIGPIFGFNLLHLKKQSQLLSLTLAGIILYLVVFFFLHFGLNINVLDAIAISFMLSKFIIEFSIIYLNYYYNMIPFKVLLVVSIIIFSPLLLLFV